MSEPASKKQKTEETPAEAPVEEAEEAKAEAEEVKEEAPPPELEKDAPAAKGPKLKDPIAFNTEDTTMNVMPSTVGNILMPLIDGGLQYLLAGVRANVGVKSGRYMFEVKVLELMNPADDPAARQRTPMPRNQLRIGFSTPGSSLFLGDTAESIAFDTEGSLLHDKKKTPTKASFGADDVVAVVLNLEKGPNANTVSLFVNGVRATQPQALPESLQGETLCPAVTWKNMTLCYNFGAAPLVPLPFSCRMVGDATAKDVEVVAAAPAPKDGKHEVLFPVCLPDEGTFAWLDTFLEKNPQYTELSDRAILAWAEKSGLWRPKGYAQKTSQDKPEMGFGISVMDDRSVQRVLQAVAPIQNRNYVVMEVKSNLVKDERKELASKWASTGFKRTALVLMGDPPAVMKKKFQELILKDKQEKSDAEFKAKQEEEKRKKAVEKRQKMLEKEKKKQLKKLEYIKKKQEAKLEFEKKKKEAEEKGEEAPAEEEPPAEEEEKEADEDEEEDADMEEEPPKVELTNEEKKMTFYKASPPDLTSYALNTAFMKFSCPEKEEGFDEVRSEWAALPKSKEYLKTWIQEKKTTTRIEDLAPGEWFQGKWKEWQKCLQAWHAKQNAFKTAVAKKAADKATKEARKAATVAAKEAKAKAVAAAKEKAKEAGEEAKEEDKMEVEEEEEEEAESEEEEDRVDFDKLDVFGVENILDVGATEPLFSNFGFEDWTMMSLRFELHLLTHSFKRDVSDPDRQGIHLDHMAFYYNKYFKKALNTKFYGVDTTTELLELVRDTIVATKGKVLEAQLPDDMESLGVFVMLTEEMRRDRMRRIDLGDESARLKLSQGAVPGMPGQPVRPQMTGVRPGFMPGPAAAGAVRPGMQQGWGVRPGMQWGAPIRPTGMNPGFAARPGMQRPWGAWRG